MCVSRPGRQSSRNRTRGKANVSAVQYPLISDQWKGFLSQVLKYAPVDGQKPGFPFHIQVIKKPIYRGERDRRDQNKKPCVSPS
jgi:hypothetical protein